ncbi:MAG TPA: hypothetical protein EYM78_01845 [Gemmatimonadetes bacterium]|nr:hypothetical protein [Gemmatimonadota bacterium]
MPVSGGLTFASISVGFWSAACGLTPGGEAYCWGNNQFGKLGTGTTSDNTVPVAVTGGAYLHLGERRRGSHVRPHSQRRSLLLGLQPLGPAR